MGMTVGIVLSFALLFLFDINDICWKKKMGRYLFALGMLGILVISIGACSKAIGELGVRRISFWIPVGVALLFLLLLIYTLFFAIPADEAYTEATVKQTGRTACTTGMYALSRHPGVLWMALAYVGLFLALPTMQMLELLVSTTVCNFVYVVFQDLWTFPQLFLNYKTYKTETPFLIPSGKSIRRCIHTWKNGV